MEGSNMPTWMEVILRTLSAVVVLFFMTKLLGKRQVSQLSLFEYITGITVGSLAAYISLEGAWFSGMIALTVWVSVSLAIEFLQLKSKAFRDFVDGKAAVIIEQGKVMEEELKKERLNTDELLAQLRKKNIFRVADVEFAVMEPSGEISALLKKEYQPLTASQFGIPIGTETEPHTVLMDGEIVSEGLLATGFTQQWLLMELEKQELQQQDVFLGQVDHLGQLHVDLYDDQQQAPQADEAKLLWATLKKCTADMELFALATDDKQTKAMYAACVQRMNVVMQRAEPYLT
jgi:uncharacterized membrane protein YcaP (DUF421 family)